MKKLVAKGADVREQDDLGNTLLHYAARGGHPPMVKTLVGLGVSVLAQTEDGSTALHGAAQFGHAEMVKELVLSRHCKPKWSLIG